MPVGYPLNFLCDLPRLPKELYNFRSVTVTGLAYHSRAVKPGYLFFALPGSRYHGRNFIPEAIKRGAVAVVGEGAPPSTLANNIPYVRVADARRAMAEISARFYGHPSHKLHLTGVTGTNGKTTTAFMLKKIWDEAGRKSGLIGTVVNTWGKNKTAPARLTTPEAPELQEMLQAMVMEGCRQAVMEVSSQGLAQQRVHALSFNCGIVTNIDRDHYECHGTVEGYLAAKLRFLDFFADEEKVLLVNADDQGCRPFREKALCQVFTFGFSPEADLKIGRAHRSEDGVCFHLTFSSRFLEQLSKQHLFPPFAFPTSIPLFLRLWGQHNLYNATAALGAALLTGVPPCLARRALAYFSPVPRRLQVIPAGEFTIVDDTALNPHSYQALFQAIQKIPCRRLTVVNAIRGNRGEQINYENGLVLAESLRRFSVQRLIITASRDCTGSNDAVSPAEEWAFLRALRERKVDYFFYPDLASAIRDALEYTGPGDLLLLLGAQGMDAGAEMVMTYLSAQGTGHSRRDLQYSG